MVGYRELADFLQRLKTERRLSPHTVTAYQRDLNALLGFCERERVESLAALDSYHVRRFAAESHRRGLGARSVARRLSAVRTFLEYLVEVGAVKANAGVHVQAPRPPKHLPSTLDADQVASLLAISGDEPLDDPRPRDPGAVLFLGPAARGARRARPRRRRRGGPHRARARQGLEGARRAGRQEGAARTARLATGSAAARHARRARDVREPQRRPDQPPQRAGARQSLGEAPGGAVRRASAHAAPLVRDAPARVEQGPARRPGDARPREPVDDADLHASRLPAPRERLRPGASAGEAPARTEPRRPRVRRARTCRGFAGR